jgi:hypothetical protein
VRRWLAQTYPAIRARAKREGGMVLWLDEMGVRSDAAAGRSWAPVGQTPVIRGTGKRFRANMISAVSNAGMLRFRLFTGSFSGPVFIDFLGRLLRDCGGRKVHLIVDGHPEHQHPIIRHLDPRNGFSREPGFARACGVRDGHVGPAGYPGPSGPVEWLPHRPSAVLGWQGGGEEVDEQLVDAFSLVVMHPMRRVGQALDAIQVGHVSAVGLGELWAKVAIALPPDDQCGR